ncbi:hypothetical protein [Chloroflexus sp.]|uniref:hypothetical protein n=1 Tax=Chloroflexus sp. TaxID=1904827 RepID=UPI002ADE85EF|nr:hypothetical protein [Chloroflexus sp.]
MRRYAFLCCLLALILTPSIVAAQSPSPITITVRAGLDGEGTYHPSFWFPVEVTLTNDGPDREVMLEWRATNMQSFRQRYRVDLPGGARKRIILPIVQPAGEQASLIATADGVELWRERISLKPLSDNIPTLGLLSSDPSVFSSLTVADTQVVPLDPTFLPADPILLMAFDTIAVRELTAELQPGQREALITWIHQGGTLLVGGGAVGEVAIRTLSDVLPATVGPLRRDVPVDELERISGLNGLRNFVPSLTANAVTVRPEARAITTDGLISQIEVGAGKVVFAAFDLATLRASPAEAQFWRGVLDLQPRINLAGSLRTSFNDLIQGSLAQSLYAFPSTATLLLLIGTYIVIIGPIHYLVLRGLRRLELAWITTPLLITIFLGGAFVASYVVRGSQVQVIQLVIVQGATNSPLATTTNLLGVLSPQRQTYDLTFPADAHISQLADATMRGTDMNPEYSDTNVTIADLVIDAAALRTLIVEQSTTNAVQLTHNLTWNQKRWQGTLINTGPVDLRDAMVVWQNEMQWIGTLASGAEVNIDLADGRDNFLREVMPFEEATLFNRQSVLENLFWYPFSNVMMFPEAVNLPAIPGDGVFVLGWSTEVTPVVQIDGSLVTHGETLYIIRLR